MRATWTGARGSQGAAGTAGCAAQVAGEARRRSILAKWGGRVQRAKRGRTPSWVPYGQLQRDRRRAQWRGARIERRQRFGDGVGDDGRGCSAAAPALRYLSAGSTRKVTVKVKHNRDSQILTTSDRAALLVRAQELLLARRVALSIGVACEWSGRQANRPPYFELGSKSRASSSPLPVALRPEMNTTNLV